MCQYIIRITCDFCIFFHIILLHICESYAIIFSSPKEVVIITIGERIRQKRLEAGMSVDELALKLGKNRATVYRYENGDIENLPTTILEPIAQALETTPAYLMGYEENLNNSADLVTKILMDKCLIDHVKLLMDLNSDNRKSVYDMIDFLAQKEKGL